MNRMEGGGYRDLAWRFFDIAWPVTVETFLVSLIASVDIMMVATIGTNAISAVGITNQPRLLGLLLIQSLNVGAMSAVARCKGVDDQAGANRCLYLSLGLSVLTAGAVFLAMTLFGRQILLLVGTHEDLMADALTYLRFVTVGNFFHSVALTVTACQRGIGKTRISMMVNLSANLVNIVFNYLLIGGNFGFPALGVAGAGLATMLGNVSALLIALVTICRRDGYLHLHGASPAGFVPRPSAVRGMVALSSGVMVERVCRRIAIILYFRVVAVMGISAVAIYTICQRFQNMTLSISDGLSIADTALVAQELGAGRTDLARAYVRIGALFGLAVSVLCCLSFLLFRERLIALFSSDPAVVGGALRGLAFLAFINFLQIAQNVLCGCLRGAGDSRYVAAIALFDTLLVRPVGAWLLCLRFGMGIDGIWYCVALDQGIRVLMAVLRFRSGKWAHTGRIM